MALEWYEGFEWLEATSTQHNAKTLPRFYDNSNSTFNGAYTAGRLVGAGYLCSTSPTARTAVRTRTLNSAATWTFGTAIRATSPTVNEDLAILRSGSTIRIRCKFVTPTTGWCLQFFDSANAAIGSTKIDNLTAGTWYYFEFQTLLNGASSTLEAKINEVVQYTGITYNAGGSTADNVEYGGRATSLTYDDLYIVNNANGGATSYLGDCVIQGSLPTGVGTYSNWTPFGAAANWDCVNDRPDPDDDSTYVTTNANNVKDLYDFASLPGDVIVDGQTIFGVMLRAEVKLLSAGSRNLALLNKALSVEHQGATKAITSTSYDGITQIWEKADGATSWDRTNFNGAEFGMITLA